MSVSRLPRCSVRIPCAVLVAASLLAALVIPGDALAAHRKQQRLTIVRPYHTKVSGTIFFLVRGIQGRPLRIVFAIDRRRVWSVGGRSARAAHATAIDTRKLRNGTHVLRLRVTYADHGTVTAQKTIVVHNASRTPKAPAHAASANGSTNKGSGRKAGAPGPGSTATGSTGTGGGGSPVTAVPPPPTGVRGSSVAEFNRETYLYSSTWPTNQEANRYQFMVLAGNEYGEIPLLKAINPNLKFLMYQAIYFTNSQDYSYMQTVTGCTAYADDVANHPSWFLHDQYGHMALARDQTAVYLMDVGNPAYQQKCATNAAALAKRYGFDGIFFDVVMGTLSYSVQPGASIPEYPSNASWQTAMYSAIAYLGPAMRAQGLLAFGNVSDTSSVAQWEQWVGQLDGVEEESWTDGGLGLAQQAPYWSQKFSELSWAMANGKYEILHSYNGSETANTFGLAAMLLVANGSASYATSNTNYTDNENWFPEYDTAQQLGAPAGPYSVLGNGVYERVFSNGIALVNPTSNSIGTFSLGGGSYSGSGLSGAQSVQMGPTSGLILLKTG